MKTTLRKTMNICFALLIPATILIGCQEDLAEPYANVPPGKIVTPPEKESVPPGKIVTPPEKE